MSLVPNRIIEGAAGNQGYKLQKSLRFRSSASAYLNRTPAVAGNQQKWTWSGWVKLGLIDANGHVLFAVQGASGTDNFGIYTGLNVANDLAITELVSATNQIRVSTTSVYRDPSAWYHVVVAYDSTAALQDNRLVLYVNNVVQSLSGTKTPLNYNCYVNSTRAHQIGRTLQGGGTAGNYFDGYLAEVNFIDGQQLTPSSFGQTDPVTGVWQPKKYSGTYGTNGFYLDFLNNTSATTLAYDKSGNGNNWTPNNISTTAGATYDSMLDVPTLTGASAANYCVLNPISTNSISNITNANLTIGGGAGSYPVMGTIALENGFKGYYEFTCASTSGNYPQIGITDSVTSGFTNQTITTVRGVSYTSSGIVYRDGDVAASTGNPTFTVGDIVGVAFDSNTRKVWFSKNGTWIGSGDPANGINPAYTASAPVQSYVFAASCYSPATGSFNFGQRPFSYTPPTGFVALNTFNLPDPTIKKPNQYMDATTFTGTGGAVTVTNAGGFQPDLVWAKGRSTAQNNWLNDSVRGAGNTLFSNLTNAEQSGVVLTSFNSNGFTGDASFTNAATYVGWQWKKGATPGFDIVTYTGNGGTQSIAHSLGVAPKLQIYKSRGTAQNWLVNIGAITGTQGDYVYLNTTGAKLNSANVLNGTSSVINLGATPESNQGTVGFVAYLFAEIPGFSKFGSYTGNGSADGPFVYCGFRPKYILLKRTDTSVDSWCVIDTARDTYNVEWHLLNPNNANTEYTAINLTDSVSNGFKFRTSDTTLNGSGGTYIFAAFAENPFKYANAR